MTGGMAASKGEPTHPALVVSTTGPPHSSLYRHSCSTLLLHPLPSLRAPPLPLPLPLPQLLPPYLHLQAVLHRQCSRRWQACSRRMLLWILHRQLGRWQRRLLGVLTVQLAASACMKPLRLPVRSQQTQHRSLLRVRKLKLHQTCPLVTNLCKGRASPASQHLHLHKRLIFSQQNPPLPAMHKPLHLQPCQPTLRTQQQ